MIIAIKVDVVPLKASGFSDDAVNFREYCEDRGNEMCLT